MVILICILFCLLMIFAVAPPQKAMLRQWLYILCGIILFLTAGLRPENSVPDYSTYLNMYAGVQNGGVILSIVEPSFSAISVLVGYIFGHPLFLFLIYAALGVWLKMMAIKDLSEWWFLSLLLYFSTFFILHEMVQIRAGAATGLILMSIKPIYERKLLLFLLIIILAILFHYSAIAALPLWFLPRKRHYNWFLWGIIPLGYIIYYTQMNLLDFVLPITSIQMKLQHNLAAQASGIFDGVSVWGIGQIMRISLYYLLLWFHSKLTVCNRYATLLLYMYAIGLFITPAFGIAPGISVRLSDLFVVVEIVLVPMLIYIIKPRIVGRLVVIIIALCHLLLALVFGQRLIV